MMQAGNRSRWIKWLVLMGTMGVLAGCSTGGGSTEAATQSASAGTKNQENVTILVAAAASLKYSYDEELIPMFESLNPGIKVEVTYDSSGKLQTQIEEGLEADVFMSSAARQMNALKDQNLIDGDTIVELIENKIVLIAAEGIETSVTGFANVLEADVIAIGDPESVPAGQYAKEVFTSLGIWNQVEAKSSKGTNVTEVLNWVAEGSTKVGVVYATDAAAQGNVRILEEAPEGTLEKKVLYPVGVVSTSDQKEAAQTFVDFLKSSEAMAVFQSYGFSG